MIAFDPLAGVDGQSLSKLADLLDSGLLVPPFTALGLQGFVPQSHAAPISALLNELAHRTDSPGQIGLVLRSFTTGRRLSQNPSNTIDVVVSGPDVTSTARATGVVMRQMFNAARERVLAVGFAIHQGSSVFQTLAERLDSSEQLKAILCVDVRREPTSTSREDRIIARFSRNFVENEWPGRRLPQVFYDPRSLTARGPTRSALHSKCVVVDGGEALVTSANFTEAAQERNIELGLLVRSPEVARQVEDHFYSLIQNGHLARLPFP